MHVVPLVCHSATPCDYIREVDVRVDWLSAQRIVFYYRIEGDIDQLQLPAPHRSAHADGLWKNTCFEAFLRTPGARAYVELNFSPSSEWAVYRFDDYRFGMKPIEAAPAPRIICRRREDRLEADVDVQLAALNLPTAAEAVSQELQFALCAVLRDQQGRVSYWALAHPPGKPDFHHPAGFVLELSPDAGVA
jgi:hypothetical protein